MQPKADPKALDRHEWAAIPERGRGAVRLGGADQGSAADREHLKRQASRFPSPYAPGGDGRMERAWSGRRRISATGIRGGFFPFLIHDLTPREQRAFPQGKPTMRDFKGVTRVVIAVRNLDAAVEAISESVRAPLRRSSRWTGIRGATGHHRQRPVVFAQPLQANSGSTRASGNSGRGRARLSSARRAPAVTRRRRGVAGSRWIFRGSIPRSSAGA